MLARLSTTIVTAIKLSIKNVCKTRPISGRKVWSGTVSPEGEGNSDPDPLSLVTITIWSSQENYLAKSICMYNYLVKITIRSREENYLACITI